MADKLPSIQWYPGDWRKDPGVQALDYEHRGIWFEMLMLMWEGEERGLLTLRGRAMPIAALAQTLSYPAARLEEVIATLLAYGVAEQEPDTDIIYCRRMVRDEARRMDKVRAGREGGRRKAENRRLAELQHELGIDVAQEDPEILAEHLAKARSSVSSSVSVSTSVSLLKKEMQELFDHWCAGRKRVLGLNTNGPRPRLTDGRERKMRARFREGYTLAQLKEAVDGLFSSSWHVERGHLDLELACRDQKHVDRYRLMAKGDESSDARGEDYDHLG
jgi:hypothetical protein